MKSIKMKAKDLVKDSIYYIEENSLWCIFKFEGLNDPDRVYTSICLCNRWGPSTPSNLNLIKEQGWWVTGRGLRPATYREIKWFEQCIDKGVFPFNELKLEPTYEIY